MGKKKMMRQAKRVGEVLAASTAASAGTVTAAAKASRHTHGKTKVVVLTAALFLSGFLAAKKLGLLGESDEETEE